MKQEPEELMEFNISHEMWREYDIPGRPAPYRIEKPVKLFLRPGGSTHRVIDSDGVAHCAPGPGYRGTVLRWKNHDGEPPCNF